MRLDGLTSQAAGQRSSCHEKPLEAFKPQLCDLTLDVS